MREARLTQVGKRMGSLPSEEQHALRAELREILEALDGRDVIGAGLAQRAAAAQLGHWWLLDKGRVDIA